MEIAFKKKDFEFMRILGKKELPLGKIGEELGTEKYETQRIFNNLDKRGMIYSRKEKRQRFVKLNNNGKYFLAFYLRNSER